MKALRLLALGILPGCLLAFTPDPPFKGQGPDADGDGYGEDQDCDDNDATVNPGAAEVCDDLDNNCDGEVDEGCGEVDTDVDSGDPDLDEWPEPFAVMPPPAPSCALTGGISWVPAGAMVLGSWDDPVYPRAEVTIFAADGGILPPRKGQLAQDNLRRALLDGSVTITGGCSTRLWSMVGLVVGTINLDADPEADETYVHWGVVFQSGAP